MADPLRLIPSARPAAAPQPQPQAAPTTAAPGAFADLLARAAAGEIISGTPVTLARGLDLNLTDDQLARLSLAADRAEAEGLSSPLVMIDGLTLVLDVRTRTITRHVDLASLTGAALTGIDGVITVPGSSTDDQPLPPPGPSLPTNPDLLNLLAEQRTIS